jgi:lipoprotein-releasing system permease protein
MVSIITLISIGGVFIGVTTLLVVLAVMNGAQEDLRDKILGTNAHVIILKYFHESIEDYRGVVEKIRTHPEVEAATPFIYSKAMISHRGTVEGVVLWGVDPDNFDEVTNIGEYIYQGELGLGEGDGAAYPGVVVGKDLAERLHLFPGDPVAIAFPFGSSLTPFGIFPKMSTFEVKGIFNSGIYEYNSTYIFTSIGSAQRLFNMHDTVTGVEVKISDIYRAPEVGEELVDILGGYPYRENNWIYLNRNLFSALKLEKIVMFIILILIVLVAAFNIIGTLIMVVMEKTRDIGILSSMGSTPRSIMRIFMLEGLIVGAVGTSAGCIAAYVISYLLDRYKFISIPGDVYFIDTLPVKMEATDFLLVSASALLITFLATLYPAWRASRIVPVECIRYE